MRLTLAAAIAGLLLLPACASGEAASNPQPEQRTETRSMRGYSCPQSAIAGRYSCARSLDREAQRAADAHAPPACRSCGNALDN